MSLNFDLSKIENRQSVCFDEDGYMRPVTEAIIWTTMAVGMGNITEKNWTEFWARYEVMRRVDGTKTFFQASDVKNHIGLHTNVFPEESRTKWMKLVVSRTLDDIKAGL